MRRPPIWVQGDPEAVRPLVRGEGYPVFVAGLVLALGALLVGVSKGYLLLYGDAVAHLAIARRIVDARWPGIAQLGGVWLPLPHLLMLPLIGDMKMWQTGMAAAPMSMLSYALSVAGIWRLARRMLRLRWALVATAFYALNANLLFLATTAMTEALFLALLIWTVIATMEGVGALAAANSRIARSRMLLAGLLVLGMVFTRYDGWIVGAAVWACFAWGLWRAGQATGGPGSGGPESGGPESSGRESNGPALQRKLMPVFVIFTAMCVAGPLLWFWYNAHFEGDWLDFMRGPYSAKQIERKTAPPGQHYRGWLNPGWALLFYTRTAQVDAAAWETGFGVLAASLYGLWLSLQRRSRAAVQALGERYALLLWIPLPFYVYSVAYGSVPIFIPQLWPHSYYNARYGMEMLPAFAVYGALAAEHLDLWLRSRTYGWAKVGARLWQPAAMLLCVLNCVAMMYRVPLVLKEGIVNATTRVALERQLASVLADMPGDAPVMMSLSAHVGAVQRSGRTLRSMISENDSQSFDAAAADPAHHAAYVIALEGDPVAKAVAAHPDGLTELEVICTTGQPCATVYQSTLLPVPAPSPSK